MKMIHLPEVRSTNTWMLDALAQGTPLADETVVYTMRQTAGRGQMGNSWEAEPDKNISFSMLLCPTFLPIREQFVISQLCSLAIVEALDEIAAEQGIRPEDLRLCIKWPNDIYAGDMKLGGILIENRLVGTTFQHCVLGIGLNVNQTQWIGNFAQVAGCGDYSRTCARLRQPSPQRTIPGLAPRQVVSHRGAP